MAPDLRERGTGLLYTVTIWVGAVAAGLVGVFAGIAAATVPGTSDATASTPLAALPADPHARSGGSTHR